MIINFFKYYFFFGLQETCEEISRGLVKNRFGLKCSKPIFAWFSVNWPPGVVLVSRGEWGGARGEGVGANFGECRDTPLMRRPNI